MVRLSMCARKDSNLSNIPIRKPIYNVTEINEANVDVDVDVTN